MRRDFPVKPILALNSSVVRLLLAADGENEHRVEPRYVAIVHDVAARPAPSQALSASEAALQVLAHFIPRHGLAGRNNLGVAALRSVHEFLPALLPLDPFPYQCPSNHTRRCQTVGFRLPWNTAMTTSVSERTRK